MVIPNMVMKFNNVDIFENICELLDLSSAHVCRVESIKAYVCKTKFYFIF